MKWCSLIVSSVLLVGTAQADLITNGSFEDVPGPIHDQGILPSGWVQTSPVSPGADTYSNDGSYGIEPGYYGNFTGITAFDGIRWVAGWSYSPESFGQFLSTPLVAGQQYGLSAHLIEATRGDPANRGGYTLLLAADTSVTTCVVLGSLAPTTGSGGWEPRTMTFTAPANAASLPLLVFQPYASDSGVTSYPGIDGVCLVQGDPPAVVRWRSVRGHPGVGDVSIVLDASTAQFDVDLSGAIGLSDVAWAKARISSPPVQVTCP